MSPAAQPPRSAAPRPPASPTSATSMCPHSLRRSSRTAVLWAQPPIMTTRRGEPTTALRSASIWPTSAAPASSAAYQAWARPAPRPIPDRTTVLSGFKAALRVPDWWRIACASREASCEESNSRRRWTFCRSSPPRVSPSRARRPGRTWCPTVTPAAASRRTASAATGAGTVRTRASAVPHESSRSPSAAAPAPTAATRWSWPATVSTAPARRPGAHAALTHPSGAPAWASGGSSAGGSPDQSRACGHQSAVVRSSQPVRDASENSLTGSPPSATTTHSGMPSRRTARRAPG